MSTLSFRQAIRTSYRGPTNARGSRIIAKAQAGRVIVDWDHSLDVAGNHAAAARAYAKRMQWDGELAGGALPDGSYAFVFVAPGSTI